MSLALTIHLLSAILWIGGMFFTLVVLRPAMKALDPKTRIPLWGTILGRFLGWSSLAVVGLPTTGYWMLFHLHGPWPSAPPYILLMQVTGWTMIALFLFLLLQPYRRMRKMLNHELLPEAALYLERIRIVITANLLLGLLTTTFGAGGRWW